MFHNLAAKIKARFARAMLIEYAKAHGERDITSAYLAGLEVVPPTTPGTPPANVYSEILRDDQVAATFAQRRLAVVSAPYEVTASGDQRQDKLAAEFIRETLEHIRWDTVTEKMLYARFFGYGVAECLWAKDGGRLILDKLKVRDYSRFRFDAERRLRLITPANINGEIMPDHKFWWVTTGGHHDDALYGVGLAHYLYWPCWFRRNIVKFWLDATEKFGAPMMVGKYPKNASSEQKQTLLEAMTALRQLGGIIHPEDMNVELLESAKAGNVQFSHLYDELTKAISKVILSQTMTTDDGASLSQSQVHLSVRDQIVAADAALIDDSFNRSVVRWLIDWNFPGAAYPQVRRVLDDRIDLKAQAERDRIVADLLAKQHKQLTDDYIVNTYNVDIIDAVADQADPPTAQFAERTTELTQLEQLLDAIDENRWQELATPIVEPILSKAKIDPEGLMNDLAGLYPELNTDSLMEQLERILFVADTWGRLNE